MAARGGGGQRGSALRLQEYEPQARGESGQRAHAAVSVSTSTRRWGPSRLQSAQFLNSLNKLFKVKIVIILFYSYSRKLLGALFKIIQIIQGNLRVIGLRHYRQPARRETTRVLLNFYETATTFILQ